MKKVYFYYKDRHLPLNEKKKIRDFISFIFDKENKSLGRLVYIFCSDEFLIKINRAYLGHNYYTDIISFDLSDQETLIIGEIYISIDRLRENANTFAVPLKTECLRVLFHGALHLCGFKDKSKNERKKMREKEDYYINRYRVECST